MNLFWPRRRSGALAERRPFQLPDAFEFANCELLGTRPFPGVVCIAEVHQLQDSIFYQKFGHLFTPFAACAKRDAIDTNAVLTDLTTHLEIDHAFQTHCARTQHASAIPCAISLLRRTSPSCETYNGSKALSHITGAPHACHNEKLVYVQSRAGFRKGDNSSHPLSCRLLVYVVGLGLRCKDA